MIDGIGIDIVECKRIEKIIDEKPHMVNRILTKNELSKYEQLSHKRKVEYLAGRFACKEAFSKAYGTGIGKVGLKDIEILSDKIGKPIITKSPYTKGKVHVSISHTDIMAIAEVLLERGNDND